MKIIIIIIIIIIIKGNVGVALNATQQNTDIRGYRILMTGQRSWLIIVV